MNLHTKLSGLFEDIAGRQALLPGNYIDDEGTEHHSNSDRFVVVEDFLTLSSFLEGNPIATDVVKTVVDLIYKGNRAEAEAFLAKNHEDIKDQVTSLVNLAPHVAAKVGGNASTQTQPTKNLYGFARDRFDEEDHNED